MRAWREWLETARLTEVIRAPDKWLIRDPAPEFPLSLFDADGVRSPKPVMVAGEDGNGRSAFL